MNTRSAGRELAFLAIGQLSNSADLKPERLILAATRTLKDVAKEQIKKVQKDLKQIGEFFFNESLNRQEQAEYKIDFDKLHQNVSQLEIAAFSLQESLALPELLNQPPEAFQYANSLIESYRQNKEKINGLMAEVLENKKSLALKGWSLDRILSIDKSVLRIACAELISHLENPSIIIIDEALKLAEKYGSEDSPKFVNGVLSDLVNNIRQN